MKTQDVHSGQIWLFTAMLLLIGVCWTADAKNLEEADCKPRPTVVAVSSEFNLIPYQVVLHRCSGTYKKTSPAIKACKVFKEHDVKVNVENIQKAAKSAPSVVTLSNHTECTSECTTNCNGQIVGDDCRCKCLSGDCGPMLPSQQAVKKSEKEPPLPLKYIIGMGVVGIFALAVLIFDATLCVRNKGFMHTIKHPLCRKTHDRNKNENQTREGISNGMKSKVTDV